MKDVFSNITVLIDLSRN